MPLLRSGRMTGCARRGRTPSSDAAAGPGLRASWTQVRIGPRVGRCTAYRFPRTAADTPGRILDAAAARVTARAGRSRTPASPPPIRRIRPSSSRTSIAPQHPNHTIRDRSPAPRPVHIPVEQEPTVLIITAVDLGDNSCSCRSHGRWTTWTDRGAASAARARTVHGDCTHPDSCHSPVHISSCADAGDSTVSTELSTIGENRALTSRVLPIGPGGPDRRRRTPRRGPLPAGHPPHERCCGRPRAASSGPPGHGRCVIAGSRRTSS